MTEKTEAAYWVLKVGGPAGYSEFSSAEGIRVLSLASTMSALANHLFVVTLVERRGDGWWLAEPHDGPLIFSATCVFDAECCLPSHIAIRSAIRFLRCSWVAGH